MPPTQLIELPTRKNCRMETELPAVRYDSADRLDESLANERIDNVLPNSVLPTKDRPSAAAPLKTEIELPTRHKFLKESDDTSIANDTKDAELPMRAKLRIETEEPIKPQPAAEIEPAN